MRIYLEINFNHLNLFLGRPDIPLRGEFRYE